MTPVRGFICDGGSFFGVGGSVFYRVLGTPFFYFLFFLFLNPSLLELTLPGFLPLSKKLQQLVIRIVFKLQSLFGRFLHIIASLRYIIRVVLWLLKFASFGAYYYFILFWDFFLLFFFFRGGVCFLGVNVQCLLALAGIVVDVPLLGRDDEPSLLH